MLITLCDLKGSRINPMIFRQKNQVTGKDEG